MGNGGGDLVGVRSGRRRSAAFEVEAESEERTGYKQLFKDGKLR